MRARAWGGGRLTASRRSLRGQWGMWCGVVAPLAADVRTNSHALRRSVLEARAEISTGRSDSSLIFCDSASTRKPVLRGGPCLGLGNTGDCLTVIRLSSSLVPVALPEYISLGFCASWRCFLSLRFCKANSGWCLEWTTIVLRKSRYFRSKSQ